MTEEDNSLTRKGVGYRHQGGLSVMSGCCSKYLVTSGHCAVLIHCPVIQDVCTCSQTSLPRELTATAATNMNTIQYNVYLFWTHGGIHIQLQHTCLNDKKYYMYNNNTIWTHNSNTSAPIDLTFLHKKYYTHRIFLTPVS